MRLRTIAPLAAVLLGTLAASAFAGDDESSRGLFSRSRGKLGSKESAKVVFVQAQDAPPSIAPPSIAVPPPALAPTPALSGTPFVDVTEPANSCAPAAIGGAATGQPSGAGLKREQNCLGCSTIRCEWRFGWGSCRAFFGEGRFKPRYPDNCACGTK